MCACQTQKFLFDHLIVIYFIRGFNIFPISTIYHVQNFNFADGLALFSVSFHVSKFEAWAWAWICWYICICEMLHLTNDRKPLSVIHANERAKRKALNFQYYMMQSERQWKPKFAKKKEKKKWHRYNGWQRLKCLVARVLSLYLYMLVSMMSSSTT